VLIAVLLFAAAESFAVLGFAQLADLVAQFTVFAGHLVMGLVIFAIGALLANLAASAIRSTASAAMLALTARVAILVFAGAMALRHMGLANEIINTAFGLILGAMAVAAALAFGLGGRETAARLLEQRLSIRAPEQKRTK
jgi:hypothetical protein